MIIAATGHRPHKLNYEYDHKGPCSNYVREQTKQKLLELGCNHGISGMAIGFDTIFTEVCIDLSIPITAAIPFVGQERKWPSKAQKHYKELLAHPLVTTYIVSAGGYSAYKMLIRNCWMVDQCERLLSCHNGSKGGTYHTVKYAEEKTVPIININPDNYLLLNKLEQGSLFE